MMYTVLCILPVILEAFLGYLCGKTLDVLMNILSHDTPNTALTGLHQACLVSTTGTAGVSL
jgi:hypothetical protein